MPLQPDLFLRVHRFRHGALRLRRAMHLSQPVPVRDELRLQRAEVSKPRLEDSGRPAGSDFAGGDSRPGPAYARTRRITAALSSIERDCPDRTYA